MSVGVNPPKTPVTTGSNGVATATLPNVCKMPGPPAPFVPTPLPNIGRSGEQPKDYTRNVKVEGNPVAVRGASFGSMGDMASKGTGGGVVSSNTHGPCKFIGPGSMDVQFEGKNVQLLSDPVTNNGGPSGTPSNSATLMGEVQGAAAGGGDGGDDKEAPCAKCGTHHKNLGNLNDQGNKKPSELIKEGLGTFRKQKDVTSSDFDKTLCELAGQNNKSSQVVIKLTKQARAKLDKLKSSQRRGRH